jgi:hypothetical protein
MRTPILILLLLFFNDCFSQSVSTVDSTHWFWNWSYDKDSMTQYTQGVEEFSNGKLVRLSTFGNDLRGQPDTLLIVHKYANGKRLSTEEYRGFYNDCIKFHEFAYDSLETLYTGWMDDRVKGYHYSVPCWTTYRANTKWQDDLAIRTSELWEDTVRKVTIDSVRYDAFERPLHIVKYSDGIRIYEETCNYGRLPKDSLLVERKIWDNGRSLEWLRKYVVFQKDTFPVYDATRELSSDNVLRESYWIYNEAGKQTSYLSSVEGKEETKVLIFYDENGYVKEHQHFYRGARNEGIKRWDWTKTSKGYEVFYEDDGEMSYTKSVEHACDDKLCKWLYASLKPWPSSESLEGKLDQLQLTGYVEYDQQRRVVFQQSYQDNGRLTYQAKHVFSK